jgi:hypothetical protein
VAVLPGTDIEHDRLEISGIETLDPDNGPMGDRDTTKPPKERAGQTLFIDAMNTSRNPASHRALTLGIEEAKDQLLFASDLLRIVDARKPCNPI